MKLKSIAFGVLALTALSTQAFAYVIYNLTNHSVYVKDTHGLGGIEASIPSHGSVACNPDAAGCYGWLDLHVWASTTEPGWSQCDLLGRFPHEKGQFFKITETNIPFPHRDWCKIDYFKN